MNLIEKKYCKLVGEAIKELRKEYTKKSIRIFAYENDIPKSTLSRIERGENQIQLITLKKIAEGFGWEISELFLKIQEKIGKNFKIFNSDHY